MTERVQFIATEIWFFRLSKHFRTITGSFQALLPSIQVIIKQFLCKRQLVTSCDSNRQCHTFVCGIDRSFESLEVQVSILVKHIFQNNNFNCFNSVAHHLYYYDSTRYAVQSIEAGNANGNSYRTPAATGAGTMYTKWMHKSGAGTRRLGRWVLQ